SRARFRGRRGRRSRSPLSHFSAPRRSAIPSPDRGRLLDCAEPRSASRADWTSRIVDPNPTPSRAVPEARTRYLAALAIGVAGIAAGAALIRYTELVTGRYLSAGVPP